jgi:hypothetical protein
MNLSRGAGAEGSDVHSKGAKIAIITAVQKILIPTAIFGCRFKRNKMPLNLSLIVSSGGFIQDDFGEFDLFIAYLYLILGSSNPYERSIKRFTNAIMPANTSTVPCITG